MAEIREFKEQFRNREGIHFNSAGQSPISIPASLRAREVVALQERQGSLADSELLRGADRTRSNLAKFLDAPKELTVFAPNVASAISTAALGFPLRESDEVVVIDQEYASSFYPWKVACDRSGARLRVFRSGPDCSIDLERLIGFIRSPVRIVAVSWVQFQTGAILDLERLGNHCRSIGAFLVVDGIQGLGQIPFSFRSLPVDFVAGAAHKWLCSLLGQGFFAGTKEFLGLLSPVAVGAGTFGRWGTFALPDQPMEPVPGRFEPGGVAFAPLFALDSAVELIRETGTERIEAEISRLSRTLRSGLQELGVELVTPETQRGGITSVRFSPAVEARFLEVCRNEKIALVKRGESVRFSLHAFCTDQEVAQVLDLVKGVIS